jgi:iron complex transport system ATP-binding protein
MNIVVHNLGFSYPNGKKIFENLNFSISQGSTVTILGPNGAGKSTLLACLTRIYLPGQGDILIDGKSYRHMKQRDIANAIGFVPQTIVPSFDFSVIDYVVTGCAPRLGAFQKPKAAKYEVAWEAIQAMNISHLAEQSFMRISGGERQQAVIARVIAQKPAFILLDEPTSHLDAGNQVKVLNILKKMANKGYGVVMTTHNPDHVLLLDDQVGVLDQQGRFAFGPNREILSEELLFGLYGGGLRLFYSDDLGRQICALEGIS